MRYVNRAAGLVILTGTIACVAASASAQEPATASGCVNMQDQVRTALDNNPQSPNYHNAVEQRRYGLEFCASGSYRNGVEHYAEALKLLGADKS